MPVDKLLAVHIAGDDRLTDLQAGYGGDVMPASTISVKPSASFKQSKTA